MTEKRHIRVFVSSTFLDMQAERDHLIKVIFPQLRKLCEARSVVWSEVDLRWGITREEVAEGLALPVCLDEIDRCRPYFIGLLGERYGWVAQPPGRDLAARHPWLLDHRELSVTEFEITHGVLRHQELRDQGHFYFRDPTYIDRLPSGAKRSDFSSESPAARAKLEQLKRRIRVAARQGTCRLREGFRDSADLGRAVLEDFTALIDRLFPAAHVPTRAEGSRTNQENYARRQAQAFIGREKLTEQLDRHMAGSGPPIIVHGESGVGKSALLANWYLYCRRRSPKEFLFAHFIGATADSTSVVRIVRDLLEELKLKLGGTFTEDLPQNDGDLLEAFPRWLDRAARAVPRIVLILDGLNQVEDRAGAGLLSWLPTVFPPNVRAIVSIVPGNELDRLRNRGWPELAVGPLTAQERRQLAEVFLGRFSKRLSTSDLDRIAGTRQCGNSLFLVAMLDELRQCGEFEKLTSMITHYLGAVDPQTLYELIIDRWEKDFGQEIVWTGLALIWVARRGLSEAELLDLLGQDGLPLPRAHWTPFFLALESSLVLESGLMRFFHENVRQAVEKRLLPRDDEKRRAHVALGDYFESRWEWTERKLDELPWQWLRAREWDRLTQAITNIEVFQRLHSDPWYRWELQNYWLALQPHSNATTAYQQGLEKWEATPRKASDLAHHLVELANFHRERAEHAVAESLYSRALRINNEEWGAGNLRSAIVMNNLGLLLDEIGRSAEAEALLRQALAIFESQGVDRSVVSTLLGNLSQIAQKFGRLTEAESSARQALAMDEQELGPDHLNVARDLHNLAEVLRSLGRPQEALPFQERALGIYERTLGPTHPDVGMALNGYAILLIALLRAREAETVLQRALAIATQHFGTGHPSVSLYMNNLARALRELGRNAEAESLLRKALVIDEAIHGPAHPDVASTLLSLAELLDETGRGESAEALLERALSINEKHYGKDSATLVDVLCQLTIALHRQGRLKEMEGLLLRLLRIMIVAEAHGNAIPHPLFEATKDNYANLLRHLGRDASELAESLHSIRQSVKA